MAAIAQPARFAPRGSIRQNLTSSASDGSYVMSSVNGNRVADVPNATTATGTQLRIWDYNGANAQRWHSGAVTRRPRRPPPPHPPQATGIFPAARFAFTVLSPCGVPPRSPSRTSDF